MFIAIPSITIPSITIPSIAVSVSTGAHGDRPGVALPLEPLGASGRQCRYQPTCSEYALDAFRLHGFWPGFFLAFARLCRCGPFGGHGYDPVPRTLRADARWWLPGAMARGAPRPSAMTSICANARSEFQSSMVPATEPPDLRSAHVIVVGNEKGGTGKSTL